MRSLLKATAAFLRAARPSVYPGWHGSGASAASLPLPAIEVTVKDLTPKFLDFYDAAVKENASPDRRWALWKEKYDFAAVPPTPEGEKMARVLLDDAWARYPSVLDRIRAGAAGLSPSPEATVRNIAGLLRPEKAVQVRLLVYVGGLEPNAFTMAQDGKITTAIPIETDPGPRALVMTHELTHAVHISMGSFSGGWIRTVGTTVLTEGLACRVTQALFPDHPDTDCIEARPGWLKEATARRQEILKGIRGKLDSDASEDVMRFTMGKGTTGLEREAYYAGWEVVGYWRTHGDALSRKSRAFPKRTCPGKWQRQSMLCWRSSTARRKFLHEQLRRFA